MLKLLPTERPRDITCLNTVSCADARLRPFVCGTSTVPPTRAFDEPASISSVCDVAGLPTLMTVVYATAVFVTDKLVARLPSIISCYFGLTACEEVTRACVIDFRDSDICDAELGGE